MCNVYRYLLQLMEIVAIDVMCIAMCCDQCNVCYYLCNVCCYLLRVMEVVAIDAQYNVCCYLLRPLLLSYCDANEVL